MSVTIDSLQLEIKASSNEAESGLEKLEKTLGRLRDSLKGGIGLGAISRELTRVVKAVDGISSLNITHIGELGNALKSLESLKGTTISSSIATSISNIGKATGELSAEGIVLIRSLTPALASLSEISGKKISPTIAAGISKIGAAAKELSGVNFAPIRDLAAAVEPLKTIEKTNLGTVATSISNFASAFNKLQSVDLAGFRGDISLLAESLRPLTNIQSGGLNKVINQLNKLPDVAKKINSIDFNQFTTNIKSLATALAPLAGVMGNVTVALDKFPAKVQNAVATTQNLPAATKPAISSFAALSIAARGLFSSMRMLANYIAKAISLSNDYVENLNLFNVSLGEYAKQAQQYAERVSEIMGIDPSEWMRSQGVFMSLADGFGIVTERAYTMSKNLTQLGYDISSFFNIPIQESMERLQSGISGEIEPLRRLGYDLSQTRLEAIAASLGIRQSVSSMTQAEKAQLRYYAIMTQVTSAHGDMARTLNSPANQLRILAASAAQAGRAIGNIFIPILNAVLPVAIAVAKAVRAVATAIASLFGYSLPSVDFSVAVDGLGDVSSGMDDVATGAGNAGSAAKKLKSILMGFDEINQIPDLSAGGGGGGGGAGGGGGSFSGFDFDLPEYDFLANMVSSQVDAIYRKIKPFVDYVIQHMDTILALGKAIGGAIAMWRVAKTFVPDLFEGSKLLEKIGGIAGTLATLGIMVTLVYGFDKEFAMTGDPVQLVGDGISTIVGAIAADAILQKTYGIEDVGGGLALAISAATTIKALYNGLAEGKFADNNNAIALGIVALAKGAIGGASLAKTLGLTVLQGTGVGLLLTIGVTALATIAGLNRQQITENINWGDVRLEADGVANIINRMYGFDVPATITLVDTTIKNAGEARAALNSAIISFQSSLLPVTLGLKTDETDVDAMIKQAEGLISAFKTAMEARREQVSLAINLIPHEAEDGTNMSGQMLESFISAETILTGYMDGLGKQLADALNAGLANGAFDQVLIAEISEKLANVSRAVAFGQAQSGFNTDVGLTLASLTEDSFNSVLTEYVATREELEKQLIALDSAAKADYEGTLAGLKEVKQQLLLEGDTLGAAEVQAEIDKINSILADWNVAENVAKAMEAAVGPAREQWIKALNEIFGSNLSNIDFADLEQIFARDFGDTFSHFSEIWDTTQIAEEFGNALAVAVQEIGGVTGEQLQALELIGIGGWDMLGAEVQQNLYTSLAEAIGEASADEVFAELGLVIGGAIEEVQQIAEETQSAGKEIETVTKDSGEAMNDFKEVTEDAGKQTEDAFNIVSEQFEATQEGIAAVGEQAETFQEKIVTIPTEKSIAFNLVNYSASLRKLSDFQRRIKEISGVTVNLKVKAGLTAGARNFLKQLKEIDTEASAQINRVLNLSQFAGGGYPRSGELFIANENGRQEMVGRIGNRAAVANQDQIGDAIFKYMDAHSDANSASNAEEIASAVAAALKAAGIGAVYLDGRMISQSINRESQRTGRPAIQF